MICKSHKNQIEKLTTSKNNTMVFTIGQNTTFFTDGEQMGLNEATFAELGAEGILTVSDLLDFDDDLLKQVKENLRRPAGTMPDPADANRQIPRPPFVLGAKTMARLKVAAKAVRYYNDVGRDLTPANMRWVSTLSVFAHHVKAIEANCDKDTPEPPKITRNIPISKWSESFSLFLHDKAFGIRKIPLAYLIREEVEVPHVAPDLLPNKPYSEAHGSVVNELIARATHTHDLFNEDNGQLFTLIEEAVRGTQYAASISPFKRRRNGREAWMALMSQYVGKDKWQKELKKQENFIHTHIWKGNSNTTLETFVSKHRAAHVSMVRCGEHVPYQLPNERTRVTHLLDAIRTSDPELQAALANIRADDSDEGKMNDFEAMAAYILPHDPVASKRSSSKRSLHEISAMDLGETKGKTGVEYRYYKPSDYSALSNDQKEELRIFRKKKKTANKNKGDQGKPGKEEKKAKLSKSDKSEMVSQVIAAIETKVAKDEANMKKDEEDQQKVKEWLVSALGDAKPTQAKTVPPLPPKPTATISTVAPLLQSILRRNTKDNETKE